MFKRYTPLLLILIIPLWHTCEKLNGSFSLLIGGLLGSGSLSFCKEIFSFPYHSVLSAIGFHLFIHKVAPKFSLLVTGFILLVALYFFFDPVYFYHNLGIFILASAFIFNEKQNSLHLFLSLFFLTLVHTFSALYICVVFYGYNIPLFLISIAPITALVCLHNKRFFPSKPALISLFPLTLIPTSYFVHNITRLDLPFICSIFLLIGAIYVILEKRSLGFFIPLFLGSAVMIFFNSPVVLFPFMFTPAALLVGIIQIALSMNLFSIKTPRILRKSQ